MLHISCIHSLHLTCIASCREKTGHMARKIGGGKQKSLANIQTTFTVLEELIHIVQSRIQVHIYDSGKNQLDMILIHI